MSDSILDAKVRNSLDAQARASAATLPVDQFNPFSPEFVQCPYPFYARLLKEAPVWKAPIQGFYLITGYAEVMEACKHPEIFSSDYRHLFNRKPEIMAILAQGVPEVPTLGTGDPPMHRRYRALVGKAFTAPRVNGMEAYLNGTINALIDAFAARGEVELHEEFGMPLTMQITADQLGVPRSDFRKFREWSEARVTQFSFMVPPEVEIDAAKKRLDFQKYFAARFAEKQANPTDDIISVLATARFDDLPEEEARGLTVPEFLSIAEQLMTAGNLTTTHTITAGMAMLIDHPDVHARLMADPSKVRVFVEELVRLASPGPGYWRVTTQDVLMAGVTIPKGAAVHLRYAAGNRDTRQFDHPDTMDLDRENLSTHMAFGHGEHYCAGAMLAKKELELAFKALMARMKNVRYAPGKNDFGNIQSFAVHGLNHLYLTFDKEVGVKA